MAKVLIVKNEHLIALRIQSALTNAGHEIVGVAANSKDALALAAEKMPEIAIVNVTLDHGESGIDVAQQLAQQASRPQIVFHTAAADPQTMVAARATRPAAFLAK